MQKLKRRSTHETKTLVAICLLIFTSSILALTGFGVSNPFGITDDTLPVVLSSFTAQSTAQNYVRLRWTTQSESNLQGYYLYRGDGSTLSDAVMVSTLIQPTNSSSLHNYEYTDMEIYQSGTYYYWLYAMEIDGAGSYHGPVTVLINVGDNPGSPDIPLSTGLKSIYPNPFNPSTTIAYQLESPSAVKIEIFNTRGQLVNSLARDHNAAGDYSWIFTGLDQSGKKLSSGIYQVMMRAGKESSMQKMVLLK